MLHTLTGLPNINIVFFIYFQIWTFGTKWLWKNHLVELYCWPFTFRLRRNKTQKQTYIRHRLHATSNMMSNPKTTSNCFSLTMCFMFIFSKELALHNELSIKETFNYYGYIFNLSDDVINTRGRELKELLKLPSYSLTLSEIR